MKVCHTCGTKVDDKELVCPVCGGTVVASHGDLSLKAVEPDKKKKSNPMGMHVSTGSGLTDILRGDDSGFLENDDDLLGGSLPTSYARTEIDQFDEAKRKIHFGKYIVLAVIIIAIGVFGYKMYSEYNESKRGADSYEEVIKNYVDSYVNKDEQLFVKMLPMYMTLESTKEKAHIIYDMNANNSFVSGEIEEVQHFDAGEISVLQEEIKLETGKTVAIQEAVRAKIVFTANVKKSTGANIKKQDECEFVLINVRDRWYVELLSADVPFQE